jgi:signal transduction histidine kinase
VGGYGCVELSGNVADLQQGHSAVEARPEFQLPQVAARRHTGNRVADATDAELHRISMHLERLAGEIEAGEGDAAVQRTALVVEAVERLRRQFEGMQWLADLRGVPILSEPVELEDLVSRGLAEMSTRLQAASALILRDALPTVMGSRDDMDILFRELLDNAIRYHGPDPLVIRISAERDEAEWVIDVADNGRGFDPQHAAQVFEPLFTLVGDGVPSGPGVGLAACRLIVERNGGSIAATSHPGVGTTMRVRLRAA